MTKSEIFKAAHHFTKNLSGHYSARLSEALKIAYAISKMGKDEAVIYLAQNLVGYNLDFVTKSISSKLASFGAIVTEDYISLSRNTYEIKETLKTMGFKFNASGKSWAIDCKSINEVLEISNKLVA